METNYELNVYDCPPDECEDCSPADMGCFGGPHAGEWDLDDDGYPSWWQPGPYDPGSYPAAGWDCEDTDPSVYPFAGC